MSHPIYQVLVGNIGQVEETNDRGQADVTFNEYVRQSDTNCGRAGGESVTMLLNGEVAKEHIGVLERFQEENK